MGPSEVYCYHLLEIGLQLCIFKELLLICLLAFELATDQLDL